MAGRSGLPVPALKAKRADPLTAVVLNEDTQRAVATYATVSARSRRQSRILLAANENIQRVKEATQAGNVQATELEVKRLKATKARHTPALPPFALPTSPKSRLRNKRNVTKRRPNRPWTCTELRYFRRIKRRSTRIWSSLMPVFPSSKFSRRTQQAARVAHTNWSLTRTGFPWRRVLRLPDHQRSRIPLARGDRNSLALAFFFACLDRDPNQASRIVVFDDPVSSLDEHRCIATIQETRGLVARVAQVCVLSHSKAFLARIWQHADQSNTACLR